MVGNSLRSFVKKSKSHFSYSSVLNSCPQSSGTVKKIVTFSPKKPNSASSKVLKVLLTSDMHIFSKIVGQGHNLQPYSVVLVSGGSANDVPGVHYKAMSGVYDFDWKEDIVSKRAKSKYGKSSKLVDGKEEEEGD